MSKSVNLVFPHQLFEKHEILENGHPIYLIEEQLFFKQFAFHKVKLAFHRASMKVHADRLTKNGLKVNYIESISTLSDVRKLIKKLASEGVTSIHHIDPTDNWLSKRINESCNSYNIALTTYENPLFINTREDLQPFFREDKKSFFQTSFYKQQRIKRRILVDEKDQPFGGQWSFDADNRKKYPRGKTVPAIHPPKSDSYWTEAVSYVEENYPDNPGKLLAEATYPYSRAESIKWLQQFFDFRFHGFGDYEDAMVSGESFLHHSVLTPMLNVGLLKPMEVVESSITYAFENNVPINSLEGFVRQIMGWREFIRGLYEVKGTESRTTNFWGFTRKIPASFYDGTTGIVPVDDVIKKVLATGYCHHIERLMILGNFMLLCEFDPKEVYRWFMELFIDAYDWVMVPNVYGMSQFADGGLFATKPYISGSNYVMKMSDFKKGDWQASWDGLFWRFMDVNRDFFLSNPRLGMLVRMYDKMEDSKKEKHHEHAEDFLAKLI